MKPREVKALAHEHTARPGRAKIQTQGSGSESLCTTWADSSRADPLCPLSYGTMPSGGSWPGLLVPLREATWREEARLGSGNSGSPLDSFSVQSPFPSPQGHLSALVSSSFLHPALPISIYLCSQLPLPGELFHRWLQVSVPVLPPPEALPDHLPPSAVFSLPVTVWRFCWLTRLPRHPWGPPEGAAPHPPRLTTSWALLCSSKAWAACCCRYRNSCCRRKCCCEKSCSCWAWCRGLRPGGYRAGQRGGTVARSISSAAGTETVRCTCGLMLHHHAHYEGKLKPERGHTHTAGSWALCGPPAAPQGPGSLSCPPWATCAPQARGTQPCPHPGWDVPTASQPEQVSTQTRTRTTVRT